MTFLDFQAEPRAETLVPPRPNLGPEPWPERPGWVTSASWAGLAIVALMIGIGLRLRTQRRSQEPSASGSGDRSLVVDIHTSPRQRLIASSQRVRDGLIRAFGPGWGSKTTEEIELNPGLLERLDLQEIERLVEFLKLADRAKFAAGDLNSVDDWETWTESLIARLTTSTDPSTFQKSAKATNKT